MFDCAQKKSQQLGLAFSGFVLPGSRYALGSVVVVLEAMLCVHAVWFNSVRFCSSTFTDRLHLSSFSVVPLFRDSSLLQMYYSYVGF